MMPFVGAGLNNCVNPCALTILAFLVAFVLFCGLNQSQVRAAAWAFISSLFISSASFTWWFLLSAEATVTFEHNLRLACLMMASLAIALGVVNFYDWTIAQKVPRSRPFILKFLSNPTPAGERQKIWWVFGGITAGWVAAFFMSAASIPSYIVAMIYALLVENQIIAAFFYIAVYHLVVLLPLFVVLLLGRRLSRPNVAAQLERRASLIKIVLSGIFLALGSGLLYLFL